MTARPIHPFGEVQFPASAAVEGGQVLAVPDGRAGVIQGVATYPAGDQVSAATAGTYEIPAASALVVAAGAAMGFDTATKQAVAAADVASDFALGKAVAAKASGATVVRVALNE